MSQFVYTLHDPETGHMLYVGRSPRPQRAHAMFTKLTGINTHMETSGPFAEDAKAAASVIRVKAEHKPPYNDLIITNLRNESRAFVAVGDNRDSLKHWPDKTFRTCVTSPPYYGLRDYKTGEWVGGDPDHEHDTKPAQHATGSNPIYLASTGDATMPKRLPVKQCSCGAEYHDPQIGLEDSLEEYIQVLVGLFREVRRVLTDDGTVWLNLGDTYAGNGGYVPDAPSNETSLSGGRKAALIEVGHTPMGSRPGNGFKNKDLMGVPWRVALALQADGWYLRQDIIWSKPNPMPESIIDRCTKSHEYIFLLSKRDKYYFDQDAIKEPAIMTPSVRYFGGGPKTAASKEKGERGLDMRTRPQGMRESTEWRNKRSVWSVNIRPYSGSHFATFPPDLIEPCILAGSKQGDFVLDIFGGTGTTAGVALRNDRNCVLCELNPDYAEGIPHRVANVIEDETVSKAPTAKGFFDMDDKESSNDGNTSQAVNAG